MLRNGIEIDMDVVKRIQQKVLFEEEMNTRTKDYDDARMIKRDMKILEDEVNAYKED